MLKVGLTGGIGSGKSTVAHMFECMGIPVYYADTRAKQLMQHDPQVRAQLIHLFGDKVFAGGLLDRAFIAGLVFRQPLLLEQLNAIVHPATIRDAAAWFEMQKSPYVIKEAALIFESGSAGELDYVIGVKAPLPLRLQRTMKRDGSTKQAVTERMDQQIEESIKMRLCDFTVINDEQCPLLPQVLELHRQLLALSPKAD